MTYRNLLGLLWLVSVSSTFAAEEEILRQLRQLGYIDSDSTVQLKGVRRVLCGVRNARSNHSWMWLSKMLGNLKLA